jgi:hypothetical protein
MNRLFIYYSLSGNGDLVAETLEKQGYALRRVTPKKKPPKRFFWQIMAGGFGAGIGRKEPLSDYDPDVKDFDESAIGSPVWNARLSFPINTVLDKTDLSGKKLTFVLYSGSGEAPKAEKKIRELFPDAKIVRLKEPKKYPDELKKL